MGLAASQARLLIITARKSDLEYRGQVINNRVLRLSYEMEDIADKYSTALSNRKLTIKTSSGDYEDISYAELSTSGYAVVNSSGDVMLKQGTVQNGNLSGLSETALTWIKQRYAADYPNDTTYANLSSHVNDYIDQSTTQSGTTSYSIDSGLEDGLRSGAYQLVKLQTVTNNSDNTTATTQTVAKQVSYSTETCIDDELDDSDDAAAMAEYELKSSQVQAQEKQMDMDLKDIDTQHKAIESEEESVKKVIEGNIKGSFKTFA